jgi:hypothetical protein
MPRWRGFFHTFNTELVHHRQYETRAEATVISLTRRHSAIGYLSPIQMEALV